MSRTKWFAIPVMAMLFMAAASFSGYAEETGKTITIDITPDLSGLEPGEMAESAAPRVTSGKAAIADYTIESGKRKKLDSYTYEITLVPEAGYTFPSGLDVKAIGGSAVLFRSTDSGEARIRITTFPFTRLENVSGIKETSDGYKWKKSPDAAKYNVIVYYRGDNGKEKKKTSTVSKESVKLGSSFLDDYSVEGVSVQAVGGNADTGHLFLLPSDYVNEDDETDTEAADYLSKYKVPSATRYDKAKTSKSGSSGKSSGKSSGSGTASSGGPSGGSAGTGPGVNSGDTGAPGWVVYPMGIWFRNPDGSYPASEWMFIRDAWYYFDDQGYLAVSRWIEWKGRWYCVGPDGRMYADCRTPDGYYVDGTGAWDGAPAQGN